MPFRTTCPCDCLPQRQRKSESLILKLRHREYSYKASLSNEIAQRSFYLNVVPNYCVARVVKPNWIPSKFSPNGRYIVGFSCQAPAIEISRYDSVANVNDLLASLQYGPSDASDKHDQQLNNQNSSTSPPVLLTDASAFPSSSADNESSAGNFNSSLFQNDSENSECLRHTIFSRIFPVSRTVRLSGTVLPIGVPPANATTPVTLVRELCAISRDSRYLLAATRHAMSTDHLDVRLLYQNAAESLSLPSTSGPSVAGDNTNAGGTLNPDGTPLALEDYVLHCIRLSDGQITDTLKFKCDKIYFSYGDGLSLYNRTLAILSVYHQTIHLFHLNADGTFTPLHHIGRFLYGDDELFLSESSKQNPNSTSPYNVPLLKDRFLGGLKQRLLAFLYRAACETPDKTERRLAIRNFYRRFDFFSKLKMWRVQLLDDDNMLIKYTPESVLSTKIVVICATCVFVFYNIPSTKILAIYESDQSGTVGLFENFAQVFRYGLPIGERLYSNGDDRGIESFTAPPIERFPSLVCSSERSKGVYDSFKKKLIETKYPSKPHEANNRIAQELFTWNLLLSTSPYYDMELFEYDNSRLSAFERFRNATDESIRFCDRFTKSLKFQFCLKSNRGQQEETPPENGRPTLLLFHPFEPFAICVRRTSVDLSINFQLRNEFCP